MKIILHTLRIVSCDAFEMAIPDGEVEIDTENIRDLRWASYVGGCLIDTDTGTVMVDENPNYVSLLAGFIKGKQCATGSRSGSREYYHDKQAGLI